MRADLLHRRLALMTGLSAMVAFAAGAGGSAPMIFPSALALMVGLAWQPSGPVSTWLERVGIVFALALAVRAGVMVFQGGGDLVLPVVDLLFLLLAGEAVRPLGHLNDVRLYSLSFALILAGTAYHPGILFAFGFLGFVVLGTVALAVGHLGREAEKRGLHSPLISPRRLGSAAALSGLVLAFSGIVFLAFPRVTNGWSPRPLGRAITMAGFGGRVSLGDHGATIVANPRVVLRVQFPDQRPPPTSALHWRGRAFVEFDGVAWDSPRSGPTLRVTPEVTQRLRGPVVRQNIQAEHIVDLVAFGLSTPLYIGGSETTEIFRRSEDGFRYRSSAYAPNYTSYSVIGSPSPDSLRVSPAQTTDVFQRYVQLPPMPPRIAALADSLTTGLDNNFDRAKAIESWLKTSFEYTLDLPANSTEATLDYFLFERRAGHCEYFSTAMAILLRTLGIPTREVTGFLGGEWNELGGFLSVTQNAAHAWTEVWFPGWGWVTFDPTPASRGIVTDAAAGWSWPGSALFDGLSFRWSSWILNFSSAHQFRFLDRLAGRDRDPASTGTGQLGSGEKTPLPVGWIVVGAVLVIILVAPWFLRFRRRPPRETRAFLRLRQAADAAGIDGAARATAHSLLERIQCIAPQAHPPAQIVVATYLAARFGGVPAPTVGMKGLATELRDSIRLLKKAGRHGRGTAAPTLSSSPSTPPR